MESGQLGRMENRSLEEKLDFRGYFMLLSVGMCHERVNAALLDSDTVSTTKYYTLQNAR